MMKKHFLFLGLPVLLLFSSCKTTKSTSTSIRAISSKKVIRAHHKAHFSKNTIQAKIKTRYEDAKISHNLTIKLRVKKDEVIWMSASFLGLPVAKVKITPTSVQYYEKIRKTYFDGDFSLINDFLGSDLNFQQFQNLLIGQSIFNLNDGRFNSSINEQSYLLNPKNQAELFEIFYWINPKHYKLNKQELKNKTADQRLSITYFKYQKISNEYFPKNIEIEAFQPKETTRVKMEYRNVEFDKKLRFPFKIPAGYKKTNIGGL